MRQPRRDHLRREQGGRLPLEEGSRVAEDGVLLADLTLHYCIVMLEVCFWYQMKGLALSYNLMIFLKNWLNIRYSRARIKRRKGLNPHPVSWLLCARGSWL